MRLLAVAKVILLRLAEGRAYLYFFLRRAEPEALRVVIFAQGRTGSTLLESLLSSTGYFRAAGEILSCEHVEIQHPIARLLGEAKRAGKRNLICHVKIYHLTRDRKRPVEPRAFLKELRVHGWHIIYLKRKDVARHVMSTFVAEARGSYHKCNDRTENLQIYIDPKKFQRLYNERIAFGHQEVEALNGLAHITVVYEEHLQNTSDQQATVARICAALGLPPRPAKAATRRINTFAAQDLIENYDEIASAISLAATPRPD